LEVASDSGLRKTYRVCVSLRVSNSVSSTLRNLPATPRLELFEVGAAVSLSSHSFSSTSPKVGVHQNVFLRRIEGTRMGLLGCCAATIMSSLRGCICIAIALPENGPHTNGLTELEPSPPVAASGPEALPQTRETKSGLSESRFRSRKLLDE